MKMTEYNSYPEDMQEITAFTDEWNDFFTYCKEDYESRQAYKNNLHEHHEDLRIAWVRKESRFLYRQKTGNFEILQNRYGKGLGCVQARIRCTVHTR